MRFGAIMALGLVFAAGLGVAGYLIARDTVALPVASIEADDGLAPSQARTRAPAPPPCLREACSVASATRTAAPAPPRETRRATTTTATTRTATTTETDDHSGRGRGRGRGGGGGNSGPGGGGDSDD